MRRLPGEHAPNAKNRSSKHLTWLTKVRPLVRSLSNEALANTNCDGAANEIARRARNSEKTAIRKQRYLEKLAAKRSSTK